MLTIIMLLGLLLGDNGRRPEPPRNPHNQPSCGKVWQRGHWVFVDCNAPGPVSN